MNEPFEQAMVSLLRLAAPTRGAAALFCRHPFGSVYFPLDVYAAPNLVSQRRDLLSRYYLFSTELSQDLINEGEMEISPQSGAAELIRHGKLGVQLFEKDGLRVRLFRFADNAPHEMVLSTIEPQSNEREDLDKGVYNAVVCIARAWLKYNESIPPIAGDSPTEVIASVQDILNDTESAPPYFPILHSSAAVGDAREKQGWMGSNALGYNCALWARYQSLRDQYIDDMFERAGNADQSFVQELPEGTKDKLAKAVASVCNDWICKVAVSTVSGAILCARHNVAHELWESAKERFGQFHECAEVSSDWDLIRLGLNQLGVEDTLSALVTMWVGRPGGKGERFAYPLGFAPGRKHEVLGSVGESAELEDQERSHPGRHVRVKTVMLSEKRAAYWEEFEERVRNVVRQADALLEEVTGSLPPDFVIYFGDDGSVSIGSQRKSRARQSVTRPEIKEFLAKLCKSRSQGFSTLTRREVLEICRSCDVKGVDTESQAANRVGEWRKVFVRHSDVPIQREHLERLFRNVRGKGWELHKDVKVVGLRAGSGGREYSGVSSDEADGFDPAALSTERVDGTSIGKMEERGPSRRRPWNDD